LNSRSNGDGLIENCWSNLMLIGLILFWWLIKVVCMKSLEYGNRLSKDLDGDSWELAWKKFKIDSVKKDEFFSHAIQSIDTRMIRMLIFDSSTQIHNKHTERT